MQRDHDRRQPVVVPRQCFIYFPMPPALMRAFISSFPSTDSVALDRSLAGAPCLYIVSSAPIPSPDHWPAGIAIGAHTSCWCPATRAGGKIERARGNQQLSPHALFLQLRSLGHGSSGEVEWRRREPWTSTCQPAASTARLTTTARRRGQVNIINLL